MKRYIRAFSQRKKDIAADLDNHSLELVCHLINVYLFPDSVNQKHWRSEIYSFVPSIHKIKNKNRYPEPAFIYKNLISDRADNMDHFSRLVELVRQKEYEEIERDYLDIGECITFVRTYINWLSIELSSYGIVMPNDVYKELDNLLGY